MNYLLINDECYPVRRITGLEIKKLYNISSICHILDTAGEFKINGYSVIEDDGSLGELEFKEYSSYTLFLEQDEIYYYISEEADIISARKEDNPSSDMEYFKDIDLISKSLNGVLPGFNVKRISGTVVHENGHDELYIIIGEKFRMKAAEVILETFYFNLPSSYEIIYRDGNRLNCSLCNLKVKAKSSRKSKIESGHCNIICHSHDTEFSHNFKIEAQGYRKFETSPVYNYYVNRSGNVIKVSRKKGIIHSVKISNNPNARKLFVTIKRRVIPVSSIVAKSFSEDIGYSKDKLSAKFKVDYKNDDYTDCSIKNLIILDAKPSSKLSEPA